MSDPHRKARRGKRKNQKSSIPPGLFDFLEAFDHDDLSDGAWQAVIEDGVKIFNEEFGTNVDPYEGFMAYIQR